MAIRFPAESYSVRVIPPSASSTATTRPWASYVVVVVTVRGPLDVVTVLLSVS